MDKHFDDSEETGNKMTTELAHAKIRNTFDPEDYLPVQTIESYFYRKSKKFRASNIEHVSIDGQLKIKMVLVKMTVIQMRIQIKMFE